MARASRIARRVTRGLASVTIALAPGCVAGRPHDRPAPPPDPPRIVGYLAAWGVRTKGTVIAQLPARQLTHIIYAFARIGDDGRLTLGDRCLDVGDCDSTAVGGVTGHGLESPGGNFGELRRLKERYPALRLLVAVGGWTGSGPFSDVALTTESRRAFAESSVDLVLRRWPGLFDGIDIDWEYPVGGGLPTNAARPEDRRNFTLLLAELRRGLDAQGTRAGRRYLLTVATSAGPAAHRNLELAQVASLVDWINVMTYDYHAGSRIAHFNAPLYAPAGDPTAGFNVDSTVRRYLADGVPASKLVVGVPFYGRVYAGVGTGNDGLFQPATAPVPEEWRTGTDYKALVRRRPDANGFRRFVHPEARVPWLFDPTTGVWITYDDAESIGRKADYVRAHGLGGIMAWELGGDDGTLVAMIHARLRGGK